MFTPVAWPAAPGFCADLTQIVFKPVRLAYLYKRTAGAFTFFGSAARPGCGLRHRPGAFLDLAATRRRGRLRYIYFGYSSNKIPHPRPWVKKVAERRKKTAHGETVGEPAELNQPRMGRENSRRSVLVAPAGAWMVLLTQPTVSPQAAICRASGAEIAPSRRATPDISQPRSGWSGVWL